MIEVTPELKAALIKANCDNTDYFFKLAYQLAVKFTGLKLPPNSTEIKNILLGNGEHDGKNAKRIFDLLGNRDFKWQLLDDCFSYCVENNIDFYQYSETSKPDTQKRARCELLNAYVFGLGIGLKSLANHLQQEDRSFVPELLMADDSGEAKLLAKFVTNGIGYDGVCDDNDVYFLTPLYPGDLSCVTFKYVRTRKENTIVDNELSRFHESEKPVSRQETPIYQPDKTIPKIKVWSFGDRMKLFLSVFWIAIHLLMILNGGNLFGVLWSMSIPFVLYFSIRYLWRKWKNR